MSGTVRVSLPETSLCDALLALGPLPTGVELVEWDFTEPPPVSNIDIVVPPYMGSESVYGALAQVTARLVQSQSIGYDDVAGALPPGHVFANAASVHESATAEIALALVLAAQRGIPDFVRDGVARRWAPRWHAGLADRRVLLIGHGGVGTAIAERLRPFEVTITRVAQSARHDEFGAIHPTSELAALLPDADIVIVAVPLTSATSGLIDAQFLALLSEETLVVNVARGKIADTDAILAEAISGRLRFALDVTDPEPLPDGHPLFTLPNVLISPHIGGASAAMSPRMARLLRDQIERMLRGDEPRNVVLRS
ncbi:MAG: hydroxyacid dehydrogenase [Candidatus Lumbricidophila eiseniae]|uniref:Hydroxyacid dehydrogenase n=1 Tax=Candidatus Lumbricidiphila eiseniae TaxID=1969409 RepID=A0A2A6FUF6_9MICO|nr:MAG: hydroxyacid dehydrogenase [Candidatus Lumbricidophila eiseniae]